MASNPSKYRVKDLADDLKMKSSELVAILRAHAGEGKTHSTVLEDDDFAVIMEELTSQNQVSGITDYIAGRVDVAPEHRQKPRPVVKPEEKQPVPEEKPAEEAAKPATVQPQPEIADAQPQEKAAQPQERVPQPQVRPQQPQNNARQQGKPQPQPQNKPQQQGRPQPQAKAPQQQGRPQPQPQVKTPQQQVKTPVMPQRPIIKQRGQVQVPPQAQSQPQSQSQTQSSRQRPEKPQQPSRMDRFQRPANQQQAQQGKKNKSVQERPEDGRGSMIIKASGGARGDSAAAGTSTRVIDTRSSSVNLGKYDEHLNTFVAEGSTEVGDRTKFKKKNTQDTVGKGTKVKTEREREFERKEKKKREVFENAKSTQLHITVPDEITVGELASRMKLSLSELIKKFMTMGNMLSVNDTVDYDTAYLVGDELGIKVSKEVVVSIEEKLFDETDDKPEQLVPRAPVVCVMGHVDHGKTSLLDAIRHTNVTRGEAGGITQAIGAYRVKINGKDITFLDTPGHAAFTAMRARGAMSTDIAILVVAADDGVMPQTIEAINHAKAAGIPIIVAINKMDKPHANPDQVKQELTKYELIPEEWGGDTICVPVSALTGMGIDDLLENIILLAEIKELKANPNRAAKGVVIESRLDKGRGPVATVLVQNGTLKNGDAVIAGCAVGRVRVMTNDRGKAVKSAAPSVPVEITGLSEVPSAGDEFFAVEDERMARELAAKRKAEGRAEELGSRTRTTLEDFMTAEKEGLKDLNIIIKADVAGSVEAVSASLSKLENEEVRVKLIHKAVGGVTEGDVMLAAASNAVIIGFNVSADRTARESAKTQGVEIRTYTIIYECISDVEAAMKGMLAPKFREVIIGHAEVRATIRVPNVGTIAGSYIQDGKITRQSLIRVLRDSIIIFQDKVSSLRRFKDDVKEVNTGYECGIGLEKFNDIQEGDILEAYVMEEIKR